MDEKETNYRIIRKYNNVFFNENSRRRFDSRNREFWFAMKTLHEQYPSAKITIEQRIDNERMDYLYETVVILCDSKKLQDMADRIKHQYYYIVPLEFDDLDYPNQHKDIVEELLRNDRGNR